MSEEDKIQRRSLLERLEIVSVDDIQLYPDNPRVGDIPAIAESLKHNLQFQAIIVQRSTGFILAGNHTYEAAKLLGWEELDVAYVDVDDRAALKIVLAANRTADLGTYNEDLLLSLLAELREGDDGLLDGTGYTDEDVDELIADSLTFEIDFGEEDSEGLAFMASMLGHIEPSAESRVEQDAENNAGLAESAEDKPPVKRPGFAPPAEFMLFRFGELRAKVPREAYDAFIKGWLKERGGDLSAAGVAAAIQLGVPAEAVEPALVEGTERWL